MACLTLKYVITYYIGSLSFDCYTIQKKSFCLISNIVSFCLVGYTHVYLFHMQETISRQFIFSFVFDLRERTHKQGWGLGRWGDLI